jgi:hypothetical protein
MQAKPITLYDSSASGSVAFSALTKEVLKRLGKPL